MLQALVNLDVGLLLLGVGGVGGEDSLGIGKTGSDVLRAERWRGEMALWVVVD